MTGYNLNCIAKIKELIFDNNLREETAKSLNLKLKKWIYDDELYYILKYDKEWLSSELESTIGLLRSLIFKEDGTIIVFAPPKSSNISGINFEESDNKYISETFIEGTMINVFYDKKWQIATRTSIGGKINFYMENGFKSDDTFKSMFEDCCTELGLDISELNKNYMYSFVMQHPNNRIVKPIKEKKLYLVEVYTIDGLEIKIVDYKNMNNFEYIREKVKYPKQIPLESIDDLNKCKDELSSMNTNYQTMGFIVKDNKGNRYKFRNPNYEHVRMLRGNQPKLQFQYLSLRQAGKVKEYLQYYPEQKQVFNEYRNLMHDYTNQLFTNYLKCYVKKEAELKTFPDNYKTHMYKLHHDNYLPDMLPKNEYMTKRFVINYVNSLHPAKQMFSLNFSKRKQHVAEEKKETLVQEEA
jgi:hypothetical protein